MIRRHAFAQSLVLTAVLFCLHPSYAQVKSKQTPEVLSSAESRIAEGFRNPPKTARPWVFWMWLRVQTNHAAITADLEEMYAKGIEGAILYDSGVGTEMQGSTKMVLGNKDYEQVKTSDFPDAHFTKVPAGPMQSWQPESRELVRFAAKEAGRLGIKLVVTIGLGGTSGPIPAEYGQQRLVWSELSVNGPAEIDAVFPAPTNTVAPSRTTPKVLVQPDPPPGSGGAPAKDIAVLAVPDRDGFGPDEVIRLTEQIDSSGRLRWKAPAGNWKLLRFAYEPTGRKNAWGLYTDGMSTEALDKTWEVTIGSILKEMSPAERRGLYGVEDDSWEAGTTTWTKLFATDFKNSRGYDLISWLPVLAGRQMESEATSEGIKRDYYRTIADLVAQKHYAYFGELARRNRLVSFSEAAGPNSGQLDPLQDSKGVDIAMGEFWAPSPHRPTPATRFLVRDTASANHVYGKPITGCESFTSVGPHWEESFFDLKNAADQAFTDGCNLNVIHVFSQSPSVTAKPGYVYFAGTHYGRNTTWWEQTPAFNAYLGRASFLLQQGLFVADALYYRGDGIGQVEQRKTKLALPAEGYDHDNINLDALLTRLSVKGGRLTLPNGMSYRMLVLPDDALMTPQALEKIASLVQAGATVVGPRPKGIAGRVTKPEEKSRFDLEVSRLWGEGTATRKVGAGQVFMTDPKDVLQALHILPDFEFAGLSNKGELDWIHRQLGSTEVYFVASRWDPTEKVNCTFRVTGKQPELWDPVTDEIRDARAFSQQEGRTTVPLEFEPRGSVFVVFRKPISRQASGSAASNYPRVETFMSLNGPWDIAFDPRWGGPEQIRFDSLVDWTKRPESSIQHYSGTAKYRKSFSIQAMPPKGQRLLLNLGEVHEIASVRLNSVDLGVVWTKPARVDITKIAHAGPNTLEVTVVNLWPNRLIGDESLPQKDRLTETNVHKFSAKTPLYPSGLDGPVTIETAAF